MERNRNQIEDYGSWDCSHSSNATSVCDSPSFVSRARKPVGTAADSIGSATLLSQTRIDLPEDDGWSFRRRHNAIFQKCRAPRKSKTSHSSHGGYRLRQLNRAEDQRRSRFEPCCRWQRLTEHKSWHPSLPFCFFFVLIVAEPKKRILMRRRKLR